jgi:hypothetical protein
MSDSQVPYKDAPQAATHPKHCCYAWNLQHFVSTPEYLSSECGVCGRITGFKWRKIWRRLLSLLTSEPHYREDGEQV